MIVIQFASGAKVRQGAQSVTRIASLFPKDLPQLGHFLERELVRSSTHSLQKTCPHVLMAVFLKFLWQTVQMAIIWEEKRTVGQSTSIEIERYVALTRSISYSPL